MLPNNRKSTLNPFSLPTETNARYIMVVVAFLVFLWVLGYLSIIIIFGVQGLQDMNDTHQLSVSYDYIIRDTAPTVLVGQRFTEEQDAKLFRLQVVSKQLFIKSSKVFLYGLVFPLFFVLLTFVYYFLHPLILRYKYHFKELHKEQDPGLIETVQSLSKSVGILRPPRIFIGGLSADAQVYGFKNDYIIRLGHFMPLLRAKNPEAFQTIILHELAHITNGDVSRAYFTQGIWLSSIIALEVFILSRLYMGLYLYGVIIIPIIIIGLKALIYLFLLRIMIYNLLRIREHYADWRVASWGNRLQLEDMLDKIKADSNFIVSFFKNHPPERERLKVLRDSTQLFGVRLDIALFSGVLTGMLLSNANVLFYANLSGITAIGDFILGFIGQHFLFQVGETVSLFDVIATYATSTGISILVGILDSWGDLLSALLCVGIVGTQLQRSSVLDLQVRPNFGNWIIMQLKLAFFMAIGLELGFLVNIDWTYYETAPGSHLSIIAISFISIIVFSILIFFWMAFVKFINVLFLGAHVGIRIPRFGRLAAALISFILLSVIYGPFNLWRILILGPFSIPGISDSVMMVGYNANRDYLLYEAFFAIVTWGIICGIFFVAATLLKLRRVSVTTKCPNCSRELRINYVATVNKSCNNCGLELNSWLYSKTAPF